MKTPTPLAQLKAKARRKLRDAVDGGRIIRGSCEECGAAHGDGHHDDYSKPLDVRWLCRPCHRREHGHGPSCLHCKRGHLFSPENTYVNTRGVRECRTCLRAGWLAKYYRTKQLKKAA